MSLLWLQSFAQNSSRAQPNQFIGSVPISSSLAQDVRTHTNISITGAISEAQSTLGQAAVVQSAVLTIQNGYLVYEVGALDGNNNNHLLIIDAGNGRILLDEQTTGTLSGIPQRMP